MGELIDDLRGPGVELRQTHISWVFLTDDDVWKIKKPVSLGFLDFSTPERRRQACETEIALNRRMSPDVYLGVVPITLDPTGRHRIGGGGEPVDWAVHMKRLPDADRADVRLREGRLGDGDVARIARRLAKFHESCDGESVAARYGTIAAIRGNVEENFEQTGDRILRYVSRERSREILAFQLGFLEEHAMLLERRIEGGRIRDGHGDLRLEHVYLDGHENVEIIDCIEFNERFRYGDVAADVAFFAMDLAQNRQPDLAERFLAIYAREADDYELFLLVDFYESYRAFVRGKIAALQSRDEARTYFLLALASGRRTLRPPFVLAIGGPIASGKSTLADAVSAAAGLPVIDSDRARKALAGVRPDESLTEAAWQGAYSPEFTEKVYRELLHRAGSVLDSGRAVVLDASFRSHQHRRAAESLAAAREIPFIFAECRAPEAVLRQRLRLRDEDESISDGRLEILERFLERWEPVVGLGRQHVVVDTSVAVEQSREALLRALPVRHRRGGGAASGSDSLSPR